MSRVNSEWMTWRVAAERALYGEWNSGHRSDPDRGENAYGTGGSERSGQGFFLREAPSAHFRTSVHASPLFAGAVARLLLAVDEVLDHPDELALVDVGAGGAELLAGVLATLPPEVDRRVRPYGVERAARPEGLDARVHWSARLPQPGLSGLLFANEWLDNVPVEVAATDDDGALRQVLVREDGTERLGGDLPSADAQWLERWWPLAGEPGLRAEVGRPRDAAWQAAAGVLERGLAVAVDYAHERGARPLGGTLTGYRNGREVPPVPDGSCDLTAHVALDACAGAHAVLRTQREMLHALGVRGTRPPLSLAGTDPAAYVRQLAAAGEAAELTDSAGLGAFSWLLQPVGGCPLPPLD